MVAPCKETLRLYPIVTEALRTLTAPFTLGDTALPAGTAVAANIVMAHRDPNLYPEPERFRPERFLERRFSPFEFLPFGGGHRRCIGAAFASYEMKIVLGTLLANYDVELVNTAPSKPVRRNVTVAPHDGVPVQTALAVGGNQPESRIAALACSQRRCLSGHRSTTRESTHSF